MIALMTLLIILVSYVATSSMEDEHKVPFYIVFAIVAIIYLLTLFF